MNPIYQFYRLGSVRQVKTSKKSIIKKPSCQDEWKQGWKWEKASAINGAFSLRYPLARCIWHRDPNRKRATQTEDTEFRATFGCGILVFLSLWSTLEMADLLPDGGTIDHLLWTLLFLKMYSNQKALCSLAGGVDATTFRKWTKLFIASIASLEPFLVSTQDFALNSHDASTR